MHIFVLSIYCPENDVMLYASPVVIVKCDTQARLVVLGKAFFKRCFCTILKVH